MILEHEFTKEKLANELVLLFNDSKELDMIVERARNSYIDASSKMLSIVSEVLK